jgi:hypothetical protein
MWYVKGILFLKEFQGIQGIQGEAGAQVAGTTRIKGDTWENKGLQGIRRYKLARCKRSRWLHRSLKN